MSAQNDLSNTLRFSCPACRAELAVPFSMAGVEGPCPSCFQAIRAPGLESLPVAAAWLPPPPQLPPPIAPGPESIDNTVLPPVRSYSEPGASVAVAPLFPPAREQALRPIPPLVNSRKEMLASVPAQPVDRGFRAKLAIPPADEPLDDTWKDRHRDQHRSTRRARRAERAADTFLNSRSFRLVRVGLILASGVMLTFLFNYLRNHQWRLPGFGPSVAEKKADPVVPPGKTRPSGTDANELMADDDAEIPPASNTIPASPRTGTATQPFSGSQR